MSVSFFEGGENKNKPLFLGLVLCMSAVGISHSGK